MREPFIEKDNRKTPGFNIGVLFNSKTTVKGDVGIEIEIEGKNLLTPFKGQQPPAPWIYKEDHSLRGAENGEYVLKNPIPFDKVEDALKKLFDAFAANNAVFDDSNRTSVHVHLNCQSFHLNRLAVFMAAWFTLEEPLTQWCGEHRVGNLFCLRSRDATGIVSHLRKFLKSDGKYELQDNLHYAGLNAHALRKFGSIEIRTMRGVSDPNVIKDWVEILRRIYDYSANFEDPRDFCGLFSGLGPLQMFTTILGDKVGIVRSGINWTDEDVRSSMYRGIRLAQDLCYCRDWTLYRPQELKEDPFKRDAKKVAKKVQGFDLPDSWLQSSSPITLSETVANYTAFINNSPPVTW